MIQQLAALRGIGVQSATVLVREGFVREFANGKALGSYAGLTPTPFSSGAAEREQGIGKAGNRRLRTVMIELAWLWQRYQPGSALVGWFRERVSGTGRRMRKVMVVAMARRLLIALWQFATQGVVTLRGPATERRRGEPGVRAEPLAIGEFAHEGFSYKHGGALYANPPKANELLDHFLRPVGSLFLKYCVTAPLQFGDLRAH